MMGYGINVAKASRESRTRRIAAIKHNIRTLLAKSRTYTGADARDQVASALAAEKFQGEPLHVAIGLVA